jgi:multiple sugar transport system permease protein
LWRPYLNRGIAGMKSKDSRLLENTVKAFGFLAPFLLLYTIFIIWPVIQGVYVSFHKWGLMGKIRFVGLSNYQKFLTEKYFWDALWHTTFFVIIAVPSVIIASLVLALLANRDSGFKKLFRVCFYIPCVLSVSVISFMAIYLYSPYTGFISTILHTLKAIPDGMEIQWLMSIQLIWFVVTLTTVWWTTGFSMMLYISAMQDIPITVYEAAEIDGASKVRQLFQLTLPLLKPTTYLILLLQIIASFKIFGQIYLISRGGPGTATRPLIQLIYESAFRDNDLGYSAAMSYALFLILVVLSLVQIQYQNYKERTS